MKTKMTNLFSRVLLGVTFMITLANSGKVLAQSKSSNNLNVTSVTFNYQYNVCYGGMVKVFEIKFENLSSDTMDIQETDFQSYSNPFSAPDSLFFYKGSKNIGKTKFISGNTSLYLSLKIKPKGTETVEVICKTIKGTNQTGFHIYCQRVGYMINSYSWMMNAYPNLQSPWFGTYDCTQPILTDTKNINFSGPICYDTFGDTLGLMEFTITNPNKDSMTIDGFKIRTDIQSWTAQVDSFLIYQDKKILSKIIPSGNYAGVYFYKSIPGLKTVTFRVVSKLSSLGSLPYFEIDSVLWTLDKKKRVSDTWLGSSGGGYIYDCKPKIYLYPSTPYGKNTVCSEDWVSIYADNRSMFEIVKQEYFINGKLFLKNKSFEFNNVQIPLTAPTTKVVVKITDTTGRTAIDSVTFTVKESPKLKLSVSSTILCAGKSVLFTVDTVGLSWWFWDGDHSSYEIIKDFWDPGKHSLFIVGKNGCMNDTTVDVYKVSGQAKPTILTDEWVLGSSVKADSFVWFRMNDTTNKWITVSNSNKMFMNNLSKGKYIVRAFNKNGCEEESDAVIYKGWIQKDSLPHVKLFYSAPKAGTSFCTSDKVIATRKILETVYPVVNEEWYLNGKKISFSSSQIYDGMQYTVPMGTSTVKLKVIITDKIGKKASDSLTLNVDKSPKASITASATKMCAGNSITITADTAGLYQWVWNQGKASKTTNTLVVKKEGEYTFTAISKNGCTQDSVITITEFSTQAKPTVISNKWTLGSSVKADSFVWYRLNDTTNKYKKISSSNKMFITEFREGYYMVEAWNSSGCVSSSDNSHHAGYIAKDSIPHVKILISASKPGSKFCKEEKVVASRKIETVSPITNEEWYLNGNKISFSSSQLYDGMQYTVPMGTSTVKLKVIVTNKLGKTGTDSIMLTVLKNPKAVVTLSESKICTGEKTTIIADVSNLSKWAWNNDKLSIYSNKLIVDESGKYLFTAISTDGCMTDTTVVVGTFPNQSKPTIVMNDWVLGSSVKADSFSWSKYNDTLKKWINISNSNNMFVSRTDKGFYMVKAWNSNGCSAESDMVFHSGYTIKDSLPHVKLFYSAPKAGTSFCTSDKVIATRKILETVYPVVNEEWYLNGKKISFSSGQLHDGMEYFVPMATGKVKVKIVITDKVGKTAVDSFILNINKSPKASIKLSASNFCSGSNVTITADTTNISQYAWNNDKLSVYPTKLSITESGSYKFTVISKDGCLADTTVMVTKLQTPNKPVGFSNDWAIGSSESADSFVWHRLNDTTNKFERIKNSNKMFVRELRKGYYYVDLFNKNGCSSSSSVFFHKGYVIMDSMPHVKLRITASKPGTKFCNSEKIVAGRQILETVFPIVSENWYLNGNKIPFTQNQLFDAMEYSIPMIAGKVKLKVVVTDKIGKVASDSFECTVFPKPKITLSHFNNKACYGQDVTIWLDTIGISTWQYNGIPSKNWKNIITVLESSIQSITASSKEGCITDTSFAVTMLPAQERLVISSYDTMLWVNQNAFNVEWFYNSNSVSAGKQIVLTKQSGLYQVRASNSYGCTSISNLFLFTYVGPQDPITYKDSSQVKISTNDKVVNGSVCPGEFHPRLNMNYINQNAVKKVEWFLNGKSVYTYTSTCLCTMYPISINLTSGKAIIIVLVNLVNSTVKSDTINLTVQSVTKPVLEYSKGPYCADKEINFSIKSGSYSNVEWPNGKTGNSFSVTGPNDLYFAKVVDVNGCTIYSDSIEIHSVMIPKPTMALSKGNLYASIDFDRSGGLWHWYAGDTLKESTQSAKYTPKCEEFWRVKFLNQNGCVSPFSNAEFVEYTPAGIHDFNQTGIVVYPSLFQDKVTINAEPESEAVFINLKGEVIRKVILQSNTEQINTETLPVGSYVVVITKDDKINHFKLLKQ